MSEGKAKKRGRVFSRSKKAVVRFSLSLSLGFRFFSPSSARAGKDEMLFPPPRSKLRSRWSMRSVKNDRKEERTAPKRGRGKRRPKSKSSRRIRPTCDRDRDHSLFRPSLSRSPTRARHSSFSNLPLPSLPAAPDGRAWSAGSSAPPRRAFRGRAHGRRRGGRRGPRRARGRPRPCPFRRNRARSRRGHPLGLVCLVVFPVGG